MTETARSNPVPVLIAHRGYAAQYPENTMPAIEATVKAGGCMLEVDIQFSKDQIPVLLHDDNLVRVAGKSMRVFDLEANELQSIPVGEIDRLGSRFAEVRVPLLSELITYLEQFPQLTVLLEVKEESINYFGAPSIISRLGDMITGNFKQLIVISYDTNFLQQYRKQAGGQKSECRIGLVLREWTASCLREADELQPELVICNYKKIPAGFDEFRRNNWQWALYEITDVEMALAYAARGVDFIETMNIGEMLQHAELGKRTCRHEL